MLGSLFSSFGVPETKLWEPLHYGKAYPATILVTRQVAIFAVMNRTSWSTSSLSSIHLMYIDNWQHSNDSDWSISVSCLWRALHIQYVPVAISANIWSGCHHTCRWFVIITVVPVSQFVGRVVAACVSPSQSRPDLAIARWKLSTAISYLVRRVARLSKNRTKRVQFSDSEITSDFWVSKWDKLILYW